jgi:hypothetical protein
MLPQGRIGRLRNSSSCRAPIQLQHAGTIAAPSKSVPIMRRCRAAHRPRAHITLTRSCRPDAPKPATAGVIFPFLPIAGRKSLLFSSAEA